MSETGKPIQKPGDAKGILAGFGVEFGMCILQGAATLGIAAISKNGMAALVKGLMFFGLIQLVYVVPLFIFLRERRPAAATGLVIAASLVALVNIACASKLNFH